MTPFSSIISGADRVSDHFPWPRFVVSEAAWQRAGEALEGRHVALLAYWGEPGKVHLALADPLLTEICVITLECSDAQFPSIAAHYPPAGRFERTIHDLHGLRARGAPDRRPWLDHGRWRSAARRPAASCHTDAAYPFLPVEGESLHQIPVGPVHAGIIEPGHFRFTASGETVVRLEQRLGYVHKGIESLMVGATLDKAAKLAGRVSGDSTVAYAIAFARAVEVATGSAAPPRADWLRALMAELERVANHLGDIGAICNDAAFALMHAHCGVLRERVLSAAASCFGHRLMMDQARPGGVLADLPPCGSESIRQLVAAIRNRWAELVTIYDNTASLQDRTVGTGILRPEFAALFGCGGFIGRASGRAVDARQSPGYPPYQELSFDIPIRHQGDVDARVWVRISEVEQSLALIEQILDGLPVGPVRTELRPGHSRAFREGMALVEGFRGDILVWVRLRPDGMIDRCHLRDPSWFQWPLLEAVIEGNIVADFPLCNKSFNCSYSGHDL